MSESQAQVNRHLGIVVGGVVGNLGCPLYFLLGYRASEGFRCFARVGYTQEYRRLGCTDSTLMFRAKQCVESIGKPSRNGFPLLLTGGHRLILRRRPC